MKEQQPHAYTITRYTPDKQAEWDSFVESSRNGTFLHKRNYMEYHADRFADHSLMFYREAELIAILPAHIKNERFCSHNGLTYGGLLLPERTTTAEVLELFNLMQEYLRSNTAATSIIYKPTPHIYHSYPCEEDLYALFRVGATLTERKVSSAIPLKSPLPISGRRKLTEKTKSHLHIVEDGDFATFWSILEERLQSKYDVAPVHSIDEITLLKSRFPENIKLFCVADNNGNTLGGVLLFITDNVVHMQYSATTEEGRRISALDYLYENIINNRFTDRNYFDFGISVEDGGHYLNTGLIAYKERMGGRAVVYDTYIIDLNNTAND
ncbi:MAG: GNAT family N-acetyltransferase [Bacteroidaceae bacterium]|nr:GNAT family N-acetyltransferase [Bacteroidaceae bacterium]